MLTTPSPKTFSRAVLCSVMKSLVNSRINRVEFMANVGSLWNTFICTTEKAKLGTIFRFYDET